MNRLANDHLPVLIVNDDTVTRVAVCELLQAEGYIAYQAPDGYSALTHLRNHPNGMVVILDINMPGMDSTQVFQAIIADTPLAQRHACLVVTAFHEPLPLTLATLFLQKRISVIGKPFNRAKFLDAIAHTEHQMRQSLS